MSGAGHLVGCGSGLVFSWPQQQTLATQLGETVGNPSDPVIGLAWLGTGAVLAWLRPRNAVGWLLVGVGGVQPLQNAAAAYGSMGHFATPEWPAASWAMWVGTALGQAFQRPADDHRATRP